MTRFGAWSERLFPRMTRGLLNARTLLRAYGQARSIGANRPVDSVGRPIPWYTYPALEYLTQFEFGSAAVFEFGAGNSSLFWAQRAAMVVSVESDPTWYATIAAARPENLQVWLRQDKAAYLACLEEQRREFDLIAIDGRWRRSCAEIAPGCLALGGMILLDNSDWHPRTAQALRDHGFFQVDFSGFGPINAYTWTTSLFIRAELRLQQEFRPPSPIGGLRQHDSEDS